ncbi:GerAB/ArcD/ProY family transporter [Clostridium hydrogenum]|uniref:GerAB/ArcD/ProY family transporter n=1 Tax=Clostridium hydrogenum TaxID=2855764 RepID=UPI001F4283DD|nr:GerAB/ArcD/ProY family transporter [Clostridium hydrogenum]
MIKVKNDITSKQFFIFIVNCQVGTGIITLSNQLADEVGHDGWISTILGGIVCALIMLIEMLLLNRYSNKSIIDIDKVLYGKWIGGIFNILLIAYTFLGGCIIIRRFSDIVASQVLKETPALVSGFFIILPSLYLLCYGLTPICRVGCEAFAIITLTIIMYMIAAKDLSFTNLMPIGEAGVIPILKSVKTTIYTYLGFEIVTYMYPCIKDKENALKYAELAILAVTIFFSISVVVVTGVFGENLLKKLPTSLMFLSGIIEIPVVERIDLFFIILWMPLVACVARNFLFCTYYSLEKMFPMKKRILSILIMVILTILISRIPRNFAQTEMIVNVFSMYSVCINAFFIITFIVSIIKDKFTKKSNSAAVREEDKNEKVL